MSKTELLELRLDYLRRCYHEALAAHKDGLCTAGQLNLEHERLDEATKSYWDTEGVTREMPLPHLPDLEFQRSASGKPTYIWAMTGGRHV